MQLDVRTLFEGEGLAKIAGGDRGTLKAGRITTTDGSDGTVMMPDGTEQTVNREFVDKYHRSKAFKAALASPDPAVKLAALRCKAAAEGLILVSHDKGKVYGQIERKTRKGVDVKKYGVKPRSGDDPERYLIPVYDLRYETVHGKKASIGQQVAALRAAQRTMDSPTMNAALVAKAESAADIGRVFDWSGAASGLPVLLPHAEYTVKGKKPRKDDVTAPRRNG